MCILRKKLIIVLKITFILLSIMSINIAKADIIDEITDKTSKQNTYQIDKDFIKKAEENKMTIDTNSIWYRKALGANPLLKKMKKVYTTPKLLVLVSFSMPHASLKDLYKQIRKVGGKLVMRGFYKNSLKATAGLLVKLHQQKIDFTFNIDPRYFTMFKVKKVPAFILSDGNKKCFVMSCMNALPKHYDIVSGNVSLRSALEYIRSNGEMSDLANELLLKY